LDEEQKCAVTCTSAEALAAQQGKYWMQCGAVAAKPPTKDKRYWSRCRREELLTSEDECREAAQQFSDEWKAKLKSGFPKTGATSVLKYSIDWHHAHAHFNWAEDGREPHFRRSEVKSNAPIGCYMDRNLNVVYWNAYKQSTPHEWTVDATFTELGGLIQASDAESGLGVAGICKSAAIVV
jgi:hypothetical protein